MIGAQISIETNRQRGSYIHLIHTVRQMKGYEIFETEMNALSLFNWVTGIFASAGTGLITFAAGQAMDIAKTPSSDSATQNVIWLVCVICVGLGIASYLIAAISFFMRHSTLSAIKSQSKTIEEFEGTLHGGTAVRRSS